MSAQTALRAAPAPACQRRAYTIAKICEFASMTRRTFFRLRAKGKLKFLVECEPRAGRIVRYRADLVDRWLDGEFDQPRAFRSHVRHRPTSKNSTVSPFFSQRGT